MKYCPILFSLILFSIVGCHSNDNKQQEITVKNGPAAFINEKAIWKGNLDQCYENPKYNCVIDEIKKTGSPEAIRTAQYLAEFDDSGYVTKFTKAGLVGIAEIEYPFRANINTGSLLVPSEGKPINVDNFYDTIRTNKAWVDFLKQHPDSFPWSPATLSKKEITNDGIRLIYSYSIRNCNACEDIGSLYISYNFTDKGKYINYNILKIN